MALQPRAFFVLSQASFIFVLCLYAYSGAVFNLVVLDRALPSALGASWPALLLRAAFLPVWALAAWSFVRARFSDPGVVPPSWQAFVAKVGPALPIAPARKEWQPGKATMCGKCKFPRPERAHHCVLCGVCVMRYDHHCPWINNCVGLLNHKYFLLLSVYTWLTGLLVLLTTLPLLPCCLRAVCRESHPDVHEGMTVTAAVLVLLLVGVGVFATLLLGQVVRTHLPLALRNMTTVEDFYENMPNPFDQGSAIANLAQTLGAPGLDWVLPITPWRPLSDGVTYSEALGEQGHLTCGGLLELPPEAAGHASGRASRQALLEPGSPGSPRLEEADVGAAGAVLEDTWRQRYAVRRGLPPSERPGSEAIEYEGCGGPAALLTGLWSSFWRGRRRPRRAIWL